MKAESSFARQSYAKQRPDERLAAPVFTVDDHRFPIAATLSAGRTSAAPWTPEEWADIVWHAKHVRTNRGQVATFAELARRPTARCTCHCDQHVAPCFRSSERHRLDAAADARCSEKRLRELALQTEILAMKKASKAA